STSPRLPLASMVSNASFVFFFKQKTAYEIGLGIPAEPLFRSTQQEQESEGILQSPAYHKRKPQRSDEHESGQQQSKLCYSSENRNHLRLNPKRQKPE